MKNRMIIKEKIRLQMSYPICQNGEWLKLTIMRLSHVYGRDISNAHTEKKTL